MCAAAAAETAAETAAAAAHEGDNNTPSVYCPEMLFSNINYKSH